jgi:hypothetical protein
MRQHNHEAQPQLACRTCICETHALSASSRMVTAEVIAFTWQTKIVLLFVLFARGGTIDLSKTLFFFLGTSRTFQMVTTPYLRASKMRALIRPCPAELLILMSVI